MKKPEAKNQNQKTGFRWGCCLGVGCVAMLIGLLSVLSLAPFARDFFFAMRGREKSDAMLDKIEEFSKPAPEREYKFHDPTPAAAKRTIDCDGLEIITGMKGMSPSSNPLCLNLYRTSPEEISRKISEGKYDRVIVYGEYVIWDAPSSIEGMSGPDFGHRVYDSARFNDQITLPRLMDLYGWDNLDFVNKLTAKKMFPYSALYFRLSTGDEIKKLCHRDDAEAAPAGCALGMWETVVPQHILSEPISLANQKVWRIEGGPAKEKDYLAYDYKWPKNCYADKTMIHETAHVLHYGYRIYNLPTVFVSPQFFNEHQAGLVGILGSNIVCGEGTVANFRTKNGDPSSLVKFNSVYPPADISSFQPGADQKCRLAIIAEWNKYLAQGNFEKQFESFFAALKTHMKNGKNVSGDDDLADFLAQISQDKRTRQNLSSAGCGVR